MILKNNMLNNICYNIYARGQILVLLVNSDFLIHLQGGGTMPKVVSSNNDYLTAKYGHLK